MGREQELGTNLGASFVGARVAYWAALNTNYDYLSISRSARYSLRSRAFLVPFIVKYANDCHWSS